MKWVIKEGIYFSNPYRIYRTSRGMFDLWIYAPDKNGILERGFATVTKAQTFAQKHHDQEVMRAAMVIA